MRLKLGAFFSRGVIQIVKVVDISLSRRARLPLRPDVDSPAYECVGAMPASLRKCILHRVEDVYVSEAADAGGVLMGPAEPSCSGE